MNNMNSYKVRLIHCGNVSLTDKDEREQKNIFFMPMGIFSLASSLNEHEFDIEIVHSDLLDMELNEYLEANQIDAIGLDCHWINQALSVIETADYIKKLYPNIFIFLGGYSASLFSKEILEKYPQIDAIIRGDGDIPIIELCKILRISKQYGIEPQLNNVQNLIWRNKSKTIVENAFSYIGTKITMDSLDFASMNLLYNWEHYKYLSKFWTGFSPINSSHMFLLEVGRGCTYACAFCGGNCEAQFLMNNRRGHSVRSIDSVISTIKKAKSFGFESFYTCFEFEGSDEYYISLLNKIKSEQIKINFIYGCWRIPSKSLIDTLSESCTNVIFEISPETSDLDLRRKNKDSRLFYSNEELEECLNYILDRRNIKIQLYFGYYLTYDTHEKILGTIRYILRLLLLYSELVEIEYTNFSTDPGSLLFLHPDKYNVDIKVRTFDDYLEQIKENYRMKTDLSTDMKIFKPNNISEEEDVEIGRKMKLFNYLFSVYNKSISYIIYKSRDIDLFMDILDVIHLTPIKGVDFSSENVKNALIEICTERNFYDSELTKIVNDDCEKSKIKQIGPKPIPKIYIRDYGKTHKS